MTKKDKTILIIVASTFYIIYVAVYFHERIERFFMSSNRMNEYLCDTCGVYRRIVSTRKYGLIRRNTENIRITELSGKLDPSSQCSHSWISISVHFHGWESGHGRLAMSATMEHLTWLPGLLDGLLEFADERNIKPQDVWRNISRYLASIKNRDLCPLGNFIEDNFNSDRLEILFKDWLTSNYDSIVSEVKKASHEQ